MHPIVSHTAAGDLVRYEPRVLQEIGLHEEALERTLAAEPTLLLLEEVGIHYGEIRVSTQVSLSSPAGRRLRPDIICVTDGGDVVVVEVKRSGNPELNGRHVVAQVVDYAATLSSLDDSGRAALFGELRRETLAQTVAAAFPNKSRPDLLANTLGDRLADGEITLVIACDRVPEGLGDFVEAAASQSALGFTIRVLEVRPYTPSGQTEPVLWVPHSSIETRVIARTAVKITNEAGGDRVVVQVEMDSAKEIEEAEKEGDKGGRKYPSSLAITESKLGLAGGTLLGELREAFFRALGEDWSGFLKALRWPWDDEAPWLDARKSGLPRWGRMGINVGSSSWKPGLFLGVLVDGKDHRVGLLDPDGGADLAVILNVNRKAGKEGIDGDAFVRQPEWLELVAHLRTNAGPLVFVDHLLTSPRPNRWHPVHLVRPLADLWAGLEGPEDRYKALLDSLREGARLVAEGGEFASLRERTLQERAQAE